MSTISCQVRYGIAYWDSERMQYFPIRAFSISRRSYPNCRSIVLWPPDLVHDAREHFENCLCCSCIVYPF